MLNPLANEFVFNEINNAVNANFNNKKYDKWSLPETCKSHINEHCQKYGKYNNKLIELGLWNKGLNFHNINIENWCYDDIILIPKIGAKFEVSEVSDNFVKSYFWQYIVILFSFVLSLFIISDLLNLNEESQEKNELIQQEINFDQIIKLNETQNISIYTNEQILNESAINDCELC